MNVANRVRIGLTTSLALLVTTLTACGGIHVEGSGREISQTRQAPAFQGLAVSNGIAAVVVVDPSKPREVRIEGDDNLVARVTTDLQDGDTLRVYFGDEYDNDSWDSPNPLRIVATVPALDTVVRSGGGTVDVRGLSGESFDLVASGGGDVMLAGSVARISSVTSGGTHLLARELSTRDADLTSSGGGTTELRVSGTLRVVASGGGSVRVAGNPRVVDEVLSGGSTIRFE